MEFRVEELAPCRKKVTVVVPPEQVREEVDAKYGEINKQVVMPGFRPGKAPRKLLESRFGAQVLDEVKGKIVEAAFKTMVEEKKVAPLTQPTVDVEKIVLDPSKAFEFSLEVTTRPEFELPDWKGLEVAVPSATVSEADVDAGIERMRLAEGTLVPAETGLASDDVAVFDWKASEGGEPLHAEEGSYYRVGGGVVDGVVIDGLDEKIQGATAGATFLVKGRAAPDDPRAPLAGKEFDVTLEVKDVKRFRPADLDEAFLKRHDLDDVAELRKDVSRKILRAREREREKLAEDRLVETLLGKVSFDLPADVVANAVDGWLERRRVEAQAEGQDEDAVAKEATGDASEVRAKVEADLRRHFVLERIAEAEDVKVGEPELLGAVEQIARDNGRSAGEVIEYFREDPSRLTELRTHLRHEKARAALRTAAKLVDEAPTAAPAPQAAPRKGK